MLVFKSFSPKLISVLKCFYFPMQGQGTKKNTTGALKHLEKAAKKVLGNQGFSVS